MKYSLILFAFVLSITSCSEKSKNTDMRSFLVEQLKNTHTEQDWFIPIKKALDGISFEQSNVNDSTDNHSISEIVSHVLYWNEINLKAFKGEEVGDYLEEESQNAETFQFSSAGNWDETVRKLDSIQTEWELAVEKSTDEKLLLWQSEISDLASHNAYHTGQIIYIRKQNGWWK